jgi:pimeloyl-ACP methyl ester carboxylesterase
VGERELMQPAMRHGLGVVLRKHGFFAGGTLPLFAAIFIACPVAPAFAQSGPSGDATVMQFIKECRAESANLQGPGQAEIVSAHVHACVEAKLQDLAQAAATGSGSPQAPLPLIESTPWLTGPNKGPAQAKGVIYFVGGYSLDGSSVDDFHLVPYYLSSLASQGWDVILAKISHAESSSGVLGPRGFEYVGGGAQTIKNRVAALKAQGYKRVIAGGHSWGAWAALLAAHDGAAADALLLSAPNTYGPRISAVNGKPNPEFGMVLSEFGPVLDKVEVPTVLILPDDNVWDPDPGARGEIAEKHFAQDNVPHLLIVKPPGFSGHFAGWLPFFDYAFGNCIGNFLQAPGPAACALPPISNADFRSILGLKQIADADNRRIASAAPLVGKKFAVYENDTGGNIQFNRQYDFISPVQRDTMQPLQEGLESYVFRGGLLCAADNCTALIRWSEREILEFDPKTGNLRAWWIEHD